MRTRTQPQLADPMIGKAIYDYQIVQKLAEGGMGAVYLARHQRLTNTRKVIKVLLPEYTRHPLLRHRFEREAEAASRLKHDSILGIDGFGSLEDGQLFLMVPFLDGQPLDAYLRSRGGRLAEHRALHLVVQLCDALDHAHAAGVIHRDLKPGNVFVVSTNKNPYAIKLLDFGIAKVLGDKDTGLKTRSGIAMGTPSYMAAEQYEHADEATHLADLYSLAIMIWEMVTGRLPWNHPDQAVLYFQQRTMVPEHPPTNVMSKAWADILLSALNVDPSARPQSMRSLAIALASALPAIGRVPSGAEILADLAPHFVRHALPTDDTVRNASEVDRIGPLLWPTRETAPGLPPLNVATSSQAPASTATTPVAGEQTTTLSASIGIKIEPVPPKASRWKLAAAAVTACVVAMLVTAGLVSRGSRRVSAATSSMQTAAEPDVAAVPDTPPTARSATPVDVHAMGSARPRDEPHPGAAIEVRQPVASTASKRPQVSRSMRPSAPGSGVTERSMAPTDRSSAQRTPSEIGSQGSDKRPRRTFDLDTDPYAIGGE